MDGETTFAAHRREPADVFEKARIEATATAAATNGAVGGAAAMGAPTPRSRTGETPPDDGATGTAVHDGGARGGTDMPPRGRLPPPGSGEDARRPGRGAPSSDPAGRVRVPAMVIYRPPLCMTCRTPSRLADSAGVVKFTQHPRVWICGCGAYAMASADGRPHGRPADAETRAERRRFHVMLDRVVECLPGHPDLARSAVYQDLAGRLHLDRYNCHAGLFDASQCREATALLIPVAENLASDLGKKAAGMAGRGHAPPGKPSRARTIRARLVNEFYAAWPGGLRIGRKASKALRTAESNIRSFELQCGDAEAAWDGYDEVDAPLGI